MNRKLSELLSEITSDEQVEIDAAVLSARFIVLLERLRKQSGLQRNELAEKLGVTPAYLSQLFHGSRLVNMKTLAKAQQVFGVSFEVSARPFSRESEQSLPDICMYAHEDLLGDVSEAPMLAPSPFAGG